MTAVFAFSASAGTFIQVAVFETAAEAEAFIAAATAANEVATGEPGEYITL